ncbi:MAG: flagellar hook-basal body protein [Lachnospiraceae bacterium]|nr:flagellar hook-basal body protein [Lachnospiraceae bacterium]
MRVTNSTLYRKYTSAVNEVHSQYNKSMNKVSSGKAYESAAENPLAYYSGKRMDNEYQDVLSKKSLLTDIDKRLYQQELGIRSIQGTLNSKQDNAASRISYILNNTNNETSTTVGTIRDDLIQKQQSMINDLNGKYENFYIYGGNDLSTTPFALDYDAETDKMILTYNHKFSGDQTTTQFTFELEEKGDGYNFTLTSGNWDELQTAMGEQGRVDIGYGSIYDTETLLDTYTGGLNFLTGITSDTMKRAGGAYNQADFEEALTNSAVGLLGQSIVTMNKYMKQLDGEAGGISKEDFSDKLGNVLNQIEVTSDKLGSVYSNIGNKTQQLETTLERLEDQKIALEEQYQNKLGADPFESIIEMFAYQRSYTASLQVSSNIMRTSLFDFMR